MKMIVMNVMARVSFIILAVHVEELAKNTIIRRKLIPKNAIIVPEQEKWDVENVEEKVMSCANIAVDMAHHNVQCVMDMV